MSNPCFDPVNIGDFAHSKKTKKSFDAATGWVQTLSHEQKLASKTSLSLPSIHPFLCPWPRRILVFRHHSILNPSHPMNLIQTARNHIGNGASMESSARLCLADAIRHNDEGNYQRSYFYALKSLGYSIGIMHSDYRKAWATVHGSESARLVTALDYIEATEGDEGNYLV